MSIPRILFVDDEENLLAALKNMLRKQRGKWEMTFAIGGEAAVGELERGRFDVIVSDMRMPDIDGPALLARVKESWPSTVRLVLSGHAEEEALLRAVPLCHQFLAKPCEVGVLKLAIERACELHRLQSDERIRAAIGGLAALPSIPALCDALRFAISKPRQNLVEIADIIERDPGMSVRVLQLADSPYLGLQAPATSIRQAVEVLGAEVIRGLVVDATLFSLVTPKVEGFSVEQAGQHALRTARLARRFFAGSTQGEEAFAAALVHDVGKLVLAVSLPDRVEDVRRTALAKGVPARVAEQEILGITHAEIGAALLGTWGLPLSIVETVAHHHAPGRTADPSRWVLAAVHVADALAGAPADQDGDAELDLAFFARAGLQSDLDRWRAIATEEQG